MIVALSTIEASPPAPPAMQPLRPLCEEGLRVVAARKVRQAQEQSRCEDVAALASLHRTLNTRFRPAGRQAQLWRRCAGFPLSPIATVIVSVAVTFFEIW